MAVVAIAVGIRVDRITRPDAWYAVLAGALLFTVTLRRRIEAVTERPAVWDGYELSFRVTVCTATGPAVTGAGLMAAADEDMYARKARHRSPA